MTTRKASVRGKRAVKIEAPPEEQKVLEAVAEAVEAEADGFMVKRSPWLLRIDGLNLDIPLTGIKLPMFTTGMLDRGDLTIETFSTPDLSLNRYFREWMSKPLPRRTEIRVLHVDGSDVEKWTFNAVPGAMGFGELDLQDDSPWVTQVAFSISEINITPAK